MTTNDNEIKQKTSNVFCCIFCDYNTSRKSNYENHLLTIKHKNNAMTTISSKKLAQNYTCQICGKHFNDRAGLWRHNKKCSIDSEVVENKPFELTNETIVSILKQNSEFQQMLVEQNKTIVELSKNNTTKSL